MISELHHENVFVDGGVLRNYAIDIFDEPTPAGQVPTNVNSETLGFHLGTLSNKRHRTDDLLSFTGELLDTLLNVQVISLCNGSRSRDVERSVFIPTLGIRATDFKITTEQKCELANSGAEATAAYLRLPEPQSQCPDWMLEVLNEQKLEQFPH